MRGALRCSENALVAGVVCRNGLLAPSSLLSFSLSPGFPQTSLSVTDSYHAFYFPKNTVSLAFNKHLKILKCGKINCREISG